MSPDGDDGEYELQQRRSLVERWASAEQSFRDAYHARAPTPDSPTEYLPAALHRIIETSQPNGGRILCLAPVDRLTNPINYTRGLKFQIMLYRLDGTCGDPGRMDMDAPILDILETALDLCEMHQMDGDREQFAEDIELYAPGYLEMEAQGRAGGI
ncbi:hypothetical protein BO70DRAFT_430414 [Aspergillus heteromorphus CBS 117.55]|uniref:Uncharacterized protein n=1 Tax=Aspergillus heteromorphus CBS 117.55 TaxID=1448321 RepID=A0A317VT32_9EURO|nr:uncharacterized protein BO70DRAFT_430414 [Aspergillus heteromorphus CBS 117.55]PWY77483.1 hypothetical protein BO70DRAFT_430414 [Aspergillus heteromorphus CBS 117.55]